MLARGGAARMPGSAESRCPRLRSLCPPAFLPAHQPSACALPCIRNTCCLPHRRPATSWWSSTGATPSPRKASSWPSTPSCRCGWALPAAAQVHRWGCTGGKGYHASAATAPARCGRVAAGPARCAAPARSCQPAHCFSCCAPGWACLQEKIKVRHRYGFKPPQRGKRTDVAGEETRQRCAGVRQGGADAATPVPRAERVQLWAGPDPHPSPPQHALLCPPGCRPARSLWQRVRSYFEPSVHSTTLVNDGSVFVLLGVWAAWNAATSAGASDPTLPMCAALAFSAYKLYEKRTRRSPGEERTAGGRAGGRRRRAHWWGEACRGARRLRRVGLGWRAWRWLWLRCGSPRARTSPAHPPLPAPRRRPLHGRQRGVGRHGRCRAGAVRWHPVFLPARQREWLLGSRAPCLGLLCGSRGLCACIVLPAAAAAVRRRCPCLPPPARPPPQFVLPPGVLPFPAEAIGFFVIVMTSGFATIFLK